MRTPSIAPMALAALLQGAALSDDDRGRVQDGFDAVAHALSAQAVPLSAGLQQRAVAVSSRPDLAAEALDVWVPLADAIGLRHEQAALEDASFRVLHPAAFASLRPHDRPLGPVLDRLALSLEGLLADQGVEARTEGRVKSLYSTWRKMERKGVSYDEIYDRIALRVITGNEDDARRVLAELHRRFRPVEGEFDDYIAAPKANGYQSLHTAVRTPFGPVEFQLRTEAMHAAAESDAQAHWRYKTA